MELIWAKFSDDFQNNPNLEPNWKFLFAKKAREIKINLDQFFIVKITKFPIKTAPGAVRHEKLEPNMKFPFLKKPYVRNFDLDHFSKTVIVSVAYFYLPDII